MDKLTYLLVDISLHDGVTSYGRQLDFHDAIYQIQPCNIDNRHVTSFLQLTYLKICISVRTRVMGNSNCLFKGEELLQTLKDHRIFLIFSSQNKKN